jgi:hypothetical protein
MSEESPTMSRASKEILMKVRKMVPPMLEKFHKGIPRNSRDLRLDLTELRTNG